MDKDMAVSTQAYTITIGAGGGNASSGSNSTAFGMTATGGGRGCYYDGFNAGNGGSGGGASFIYGSSFALILFLKFVFWFQYLNASITFQTQKGRLI